MKELKKYNNARISLEFKFRGLPYAHALLVNYLIAQANPLTGVVCGINYNDLALLLTINKAPGRKESGTPTKQTIRNYIKSIERECGEHFQVISEGQTLKFFFPDMPSLFSNLVNNIEVNTQLNTEDNQEKPSHLIEKQEIIRGGIKEDNIEVNTDLNTEVNTPDEPVKNIYLLNINNKQTEQTTVGPNRDLSKKIISSNFYPNEETINQALAKGLNKVTDTREIQAFINHNQKQGTKWADFNPVFMCWLEREAVYRQNQQKNKEQLRSNHNERRSNEKSTYETLLDGVRKRHEETLAAEGKASQTGATHEVSHFEPLGRHDKDVWPALSQQTWA